MDTALVSFDLVIEISDDAVSVAGYLPLVNHSDKLDDYDELLVRLF